MTGRGTPVPADLVEALRQHPKAAIALETLPPIRRREYIAWIDMAKEPEARARRIQETIEQLS